ncbi:MAG TPA: sigma factor-like helix-turn-helix DNA-binding protein, partial [Cyclobacteriaceae bacterium]|nr:sigma factor-like helix-turn-helix DNA-binding protein [Cyclobacteriaceae bacterium]
NGLLDVLQNVSEATPDADLMYDSLQQEVSRVLDTLSVREADILSDYYGLKGKQAMSLEEIGLKHDLTRERVRQIKEKATLQLRKSFRSHGLRAFLG